jgi:hypothetical protein
VSDHLILRRFYLMKRQAANLRTDYEIASVWQGKQEAEPGTALLASFPSYTALVAAGYTTKEDLEGADVIELYNYVGLSQRDAEAVLAAFAKL